MDFRIPDLISKYLKDNISEEELMLLEDWKSERSENQVLWNKLTDPAYVGERLKGWDDQKAAGRLWDNLEKVIGRKECKPIRNYISWWRVAALILVILGISFVLYNNSTRHRAKLLAGIVKNITTEKAVIPVEIKQGVVLELGNGERVSLTSSLQNNKLRERDGTLIVNKGGTLKYTTDKTAGEGDILMNRIVTPTGLTYHLTLSDGTKVCLSAGSSIAYPTVFRGGMRQVEVQGEAYFEVAFDKSRPFFVVTAKSRIEVLGTSFNIQSYAEEPYEKTSLLEGAVKVSSIYKGEAKVLKPGYEAIIGMAGSMQVNKANVYDAIAWKSGLLVFDNQSLELLMHNLSRWYGIEVNFADNALKNYHFTGRLQRYDRVNELLEIIGETSKVKFELSQNRVLVKSLNN